MPLLKSNKILVVASSASLLPVPANKKVIYVTSINKVFPAIHQHQPDTIVIDHTFLQLDTEKILRRIAGNQFYRKIKLICYKQTEQPKMDNMLTALGVNKFIYADEMEQKAEGRKYDLKTVAGKVEAKMMAVFAKPVF